MSCRHKFYDELGLLHLDYAPVTLIVGTFNPEWPEENTAQWFYGRTHNKYGKQSNNFWDVLPRLYGQASLIHRGPEEWRAFCRDHKIAITDLISSIADADQSLATHRKWLGSYSDKALATKFSKQTSNKIVDLLIRQKSIRNVYLTRGLSEKFWEELWKPVAEHCQKNNLHAKTLLTPSRYAFYQHGSYNREYPSAKIPALADYVRMRWEENWHG
jgi:hypothetical protein